MIAVMWGALIVLAAAVLGAIIFGVRAVWREASNDPGLTVRPVEGFAGWEMPPEIAHEEYLSMGPRAGTPVPGYNSRLPNLPPTAKADSPAPADVPGPEVGTAGTRDGDPVTVARDDPAAAVERLSPDTLPPPPVTDVPGQPGGDPAAAASTASAPPPVTSPLDAARDAAAAVRAMPVDGYLHQLEAATAWEDREPFTDWLSGDTLARGIPAITADA